MSAQKPPCYIYVPERSGRATDRPSTECAPERDDRRKPGGVQLSELVVADGRGAAVVVNG